MNFITHNWKTIILWTIIFVIGGLQALQGSHMGDFTLIISILGGAEHLLNGRKNV